MWAYACIFVVAGLAVAYVAIFAPDDLKTMWIYPSSTSDTPLYAARITLFILVVVLVFRWIIATQNEMMMWKKRLTNPPIENEDVYVAMCGLAIALGMALVFVYSILFISLLMTVTFLVNYWTQWQANEHFKSALEKTQQSEIEAFHYRILSVMKDYWVHRPQLGRITTMMFFSSVSFALALRGKVQPGPSRKSWELAAYVILTLNILVGELVIAYWRVRRDQGIALARHAIRAKQ
jgi:hypothetical protein